VLKDNIQTGPEIVNVDLHPNNAIYDVTFNTVLPYDYINNISYDTGIIISIRDPSTSFNNGIISFRAGLSSTNTITIKFKVSYLPSNFQLRAIAINKSKNNLGEETIQIYKYSHTGGIQNDISFNNTPNQFLRYPVRVFPQKTNISNFGLIAWLTPIYYSPEDIVFYVPGLYKAGFHLIRNINVNQIIDLYLYTNDTSSLEEAQWPYYYGFLFEYTLSNNPAGYGFLSSPTYVISNNRLYALLGGGSKSISNSIDIRTKLLKSLIEVLRGNEITSGIAPFKDDIQLFNYANVTRVLGYTLGFIDALHEDPSSQNSLFTWSDVYKPTSLFTIPDYSISYIIKRDGNIVSSGVSNGSRPIYLPRDSEDRIPPGNYEIELTITPVIIEGVTTTLKSIYTFRIIPVEQYRINPLDENSPRIKELHLVRNGRWKNIIDSRETNRLRFELDPVPGLGRFIQRENSSFIIEEMPDAIIQVSLEMSTDGNNWQPLTLFNLSTSSYEAIIPTQNNISLYSFRIRAADLAYNTYTYYFQLPRIRPELRILVTPTSSIITEEESTTFSVRLTSPPSDEVQIPIIPNNDQIRFSTNVIRFNPGSLEPINVNVTAIDDNLVEDTSTYVVTL